MSPVLRKSFLIISLSVALISCSETDNNKHHITQKDTLNNETVTDTLPVKNDGLFKNISDVIQHKSAGSWIYIKDSMTSCAIYFGMLDSNTVGMKYSSECFFYFPCSHSTKDITIFWDNIIDTKYDFAIVKAIKHVDRKLKGKPFMKLRLLNDSTLQPTYLLPDLIKKLNSADKSRLLFPDSYTFSTTFFL